MLQLIAYRVFRLRRLLLVALLPPLLVWAVIYLLKGPAALALLPFAILLVPAHVLRYPNAWMETLALSLSIALCLWLAANIGPQVPLLGLAIRVLGLGVFGLLTMATLSFAVIGLLDFGPVRSFTTRSRQFSRLDPQSLREKITLYPGRSDAKVTCGPANAEGMFEIKLHHMLPGDLEADDCFSTDETPFDVTLFGYILSQTEHEYNLISVDPDSKETTATRYLFEPTDLGTYVTLEESAVPLPWGMRAGYWLQDYLADYLADEIERAEERRPLANRFASQSQLMFDIIAVLFGRASANESTD